jgi:methylmalonyl-CoA mutase cobalamin-binding domain/chain
MMVRGMDDLNGARNELERALLANDRTDARELLVFRCRDMPPLDRIDNIVSPVLDKIGIKWERGEVALSQVYLSTKITDELVDDIMEVNDVSRRRTPVIAISVLEDHHMLGLKVVRMTLQSAGYEVIDYGRTTPDEIVRLACNDHVRYLLISTLMLRSALLIKDVRDLLEANGCDLRMIVGGAPFRFDPQLWRRVQADFTTTSPIEAIEYIRTMEATR